MPTGRIGISSGGGIKSIQHGFYSIAWGTDLIRDVSITSVDISKSIPFITGVGSASPQNEAKSFSITILNSNTIRFERKSATWTDTADISWEVIEYRNVKSIQTGTKTFASSTGQTQSITSVDLSKSIYSASLSTLGGAGGASYPQSSTSLYFKTIHSDTTSFVWYLLEFY